MGKKDGGDPETGGGGGQRAAVGGRRFYHADPGAICGLRRNEDDHKNLSAQPLQAEKDGDLSHDTHAEPGRDPLYRRSRRPAGASDPGGGDQDPGLPWD